MLLALVVLLFPAPQVPAVTSDSGSPKLEISAAVRPLLLAKEVTHEPAAAEASASVPEIPLTNSFPADVPAITSIKRSVPAPSVTSFPESPIPRLSASSSSPNTFEAPIKPVALTPHRESSAKRRLWYGLLATGHSAAALDAYSTRRVISGNFGTERNPLLRPFANSNSLYIAVQASPLLMDFLGRRMMTSEHSWVRRMWWVPQSAGAAASILSGVHNLRISQ